MFAISLKRQKVRRKDKNTSKSKSADGGVGREVRDLLLRRPSHVKKRQASPSRGRRHPPQYPTRRMKPFLTPLSHFFPPSPSSS